MKKLFAILLAVMMMATLALPTLAEESSGTTTIYFDIAGTNFLTQVYAYAWETGNNQNNNAARPGVQMTLVEGTIYKTEIPSGFDKIIFNDGSYQTPEETIPTDGKNLYSFSNSTGAWEWSTYGSAASNESSPNKPTGDNTIDVSGEYVPGGDAQEKIIVDIAWDAMNFTYTAGSSSYDSVTHKTTTTAGSWSDNKSGITVTNHSNAAIKASFSFSSSADGVKGTFYTDAAGSVALPANQQYRNIDSAEGTTNGLSQTIYFGISGGAISENKTLGTITVCLEGPKWQTVTTEEALKAALLAGGYVKLGADIDLSECLILRSAVSATLDLNGHTLTAPAGNNAIRVDDASCSLTVQDTAGGGKIVSDDTAILVTSGTLRVKGGKIHSTGGYAVDLKENTKATVSGGVISGEISGVIAVANTELTITGGAISAGKIAVSARGIVAISGGTLTGSNMALNCDGTGSLTISGGTFNGNGSQTAQAAYIGSSDATITGGTFNGIVGCTSDLTISGGTFNYIVMNIGTKALTITGGTYSFDPTAYVDTAIYTVTPNANGTWTVAANA